MRLLCINKNLFSEDGIKLLRKNKIAISFTDNLKKINDYDILLIRPDANLIGMINNDTKIKYIISVSTGTNHLDLDFLSKKNIRLFYLKNKTFLKNIKATSEHSIFLILSSVRKVNNLIHQPLNFRKKYISSEIANLNIGILGYGRVGSQVASILKSFGAKIFIYDIKNKKLPSYIKRCSSMEDLFVKSELISLHIPLSNDNYDLIDKKYFFSLQNKILINTSRAEVINENFLINMIKKKRIVYYSDVIHNENLPFNDNKLAKLKSYDNLFITPHVAGITKESIKKTDLFIINLFLNEINKKK